MNCSAAVKVGHPYPRNSSVCPRSCAAAEMAGGRVTAPAWDLLNQMISGRAGQMLRTRNGLDRLN